MSACNYLMNLQVVQGLQSIQCLPSDLVNPDKKQGIADIFNKEAVLIKHVMGNEWCWNTDKDENTTYSRSLGTFLSLRALLKKNIKKH